MESERKRILLSGVFGPFGVDDEFGRKENIMELFHNQVTRGQGIASFRFHHRSFGLYFIAENVDADVTVLYFPSRARFARGVRKGYDIVGISFITPNFSKAREMSRITRENSPRSVIVLGGHGAAIEGIQDLVDCDHVVKGEGIAWMRAYLGQDPGAPIRHPTLPSAERRSIFGMPVPGRPSNLLVPGVGCVNGCSFCSTSHFFGKCYSPFLSTGREVYETCVRLAEETGSDEFFVMDENFLKNRSRAMELLDLMEKDRRAFRFQIFSSAEAIEAFGVDRMARLGVEFVWMGVESSTSEGNFEKNRGIDPRSLVRRLRDRGIIVLASGILCQEHHTRENIGREIDFMIDLQADFVQFMLLTPLPVTGLYRSQEKRGILRQDLPYEEWHGQKHLSFNHPEFPGDSAERWVKHAFDAEYRANGSSMLRVVETTFTGWKRFASARRDALMEKRMRFYEERLRDWSSMLPAIARNPANERERRMAGMLDAQISGRLGMTARQRIERIATPVAAALWKARVLAFGDAIQPSTIVTRYDDVRVAPARLFPVPVRTLGHEPAAEADEAGAVAAAVGVGDRPSMALSPAMSSAPN